MNITLTHSSRRSSQVVDSVEQQSELVDAIRQILMTRRECCLDSLVLACAGYSWNQVFLEVDRMSRSGELQLKLTGCGKYSVSLPQLSTI